MDYTTMTDEQLRERIEALRKVQESAQEEILGCQAQLDALRVAINGTTPAPTVTPQDPSEEETATDPETPETKPAEEKLDFLSLITHATTPEQLKTLIRLFSMEQASQRQGRGQWF